MNNKALNFLAASLARYSKQLRYLASSASSTVVDYTLLFVLNAVLGSVLIPVVIARVTSCTVTFTLNRKLFVANGNVLSAAARYAILAGGVMFLSYQGIIALTALGIPLVVASLATNSSLFIVNYLGQRYFVFGNVGAKVEAVAAKVAAALPRLALAA